MLQLCNSILNILVDPSKGTENEKVFLYPRLHFLDWNILCISYDEPIHEVFGGIYADLLWRGFFFTPTEAAHRSSSHLEQGRKIFLKYPWQLVLKKHNNVQSVEQLIIHCKSTRTEHIILVMILKNSVGLSYNSRLQITNLDDNGLQSEESKYMKDYSIESPGFNSMTRNY